MNGAREVFEAMMRRSISAVSTIDHPYTSPPIHLFDGHARLHDRFGDGVLVLNWDVSHPGERTYRYDLMTDTGLIARHPELCHYILGTPYVEQQFNPLPWNYLPACIDVAASVAESRNKLRYGSSRELASRAHAVLNLARSSLPPDRTPWTYTRNLLVNYYTMLGQPQLANFVRNQYCSYWHSPLRKSWIPWCLRNTKGALAMENLLSTQA